ncbi:5-(carboxyamino)imidazole ribonucleotide synthase [Psychrobacter sp. Sarcosine-3u-12]|uniref:5-(carboxyamino)imidazole ribonucleotide synthase n=1 Tax=Psychrobacter sp. Sarcosine-3u-12 TaxID=2058325 RepID=UPI000C32A085|nr:5-(carboxyamino)imidazole ribonucleotide synthase [Psychrobacter sp. Sarcosine-3u-12]PKG36586.1 5-(carboxyamino)imidazole ribonucleotide synthase [Psychrobacter sp. Sarcosine-3u-12]
MTTANAYPVTQNIRTIGILGGGQLGMMLAEAAMPLGYQCVFLEDNADCPASLYGRVFHSEQLEAFIAAADVFTLEFENTPTATVEQLANLSKSGSKQGMFPPPIALDIAQDRLKEKQMFNALEIATVPFKEVNSEAELQQACSELGLPIVLKTSRGGYDGKGQFVIKQDSDIKVAWQDLKDAVSGQGELTPTPAPLIAEGFIHFSREVSIIAARGQNGQMRCYDLVENHHHHGILAKTQAPAVGTSHLLKQATDAITTVMNHLGYVGVMALELFVTKDVRGNDAVLANEIAPRVHNSGHWSIEGAVTSQFENHIRAVVNLPLGDTDNVHPAIMLNVLGQYPDISAVLAIDGAHYHSYHKAEREDRKIAHITLMPNDVADLEPALAKLVAVLPNKVGLDKKSATVNNQPKATNDQSTIGNDTVKAIENPQVDTDDDQTDNAIDVKTKTAKVKK